MRKDLLKYIEGTELFILDVGCATGENGKFLKKNHMAAFVAGLEYDKEMIKIAKMNLDEVIECDLNNFQLSKETFGCRFHYIIFGDILEHLINPWKLLHSASDLLENDGKVLISIPNIQHIETAIQIFLNGKWPYNERGIFDKTHLRFFTLKNILEMIEQSNLVIDILERKYRFRDAIGSTFPMFFEKALKCFFPNLFTFQFIIVSSRRKHLTTRHE